MDSPGERDQTVERLLRQSFSTPAAAGVTDACLDAETLAAWADGGLSGEALEAVHVHVADCARCQDLAGALARIPSAAPQTETVRTSRRWLAFLVPMTAAAAAVAIWLAVPGMTNLSPAPRNQAELRSPAPQTTSSEAAPPPQAVPAAPAPPAADGRFDQGRGFALKERSVSETPEKKTLSDNAAKDRNDTARDNAAGKLESENLAKAADAPAAAVAAAAPAPSAATRVDRLEAARSAVRADSVVIPEIISPDSAVRWRILGSAVQHSSNGGSTWEAASVGVAAGLAAGAAPATTVCWLVGRGGVVLLTTDGQTWRRLPFPEMTDLSAIRAVDAGGRVASVSTADGRTFVTTDGGDTWAIR